jgi:hypothetical protein
MDISMNAYIQQKMRLQTANEVNESTQSNYRTDLVYLFFKLLLFVILGGTFYYLFKNQSPSEVISQVKETGKAVADKVSNVTKVAKNSISSK